MQSRHSRILLVVLALFSAVAVAFPLPLRMLVTGDMHGWLLPVQADGRVLGGAAEMLGYWKQIEQYDPASFLTISCGDIATGPAISTVFQGEPVIDAMNAMGYDASALGNHEFDFKQARIRQWEQQAHFPFLSANLTDATGKPSTLTVPYLMNDEQGVKVAVIGLTLQDIFTFGNTEGLIAQPYTETLRKLVPEVRKQGAQVVIVAAHVPYDELSVLAKSVADLNIPLMLGAHDHEFFQRKIGDTWVVNSGLWWRGYSRIDLDYNEKSGKTMVLSSKQVWLSQENPLVDEALKAGLDRWQVRINAEYGTPLGYVATPLRRPDAAYNFVVDSWLAMVPQADIALTNDGSVRQDIPEGPITLAVITGLLPFNNSLLRLQLTGEELLAYLPRGKFIGMAGIHRRAGVYIVDKTGKPVDPKASYRVLLNDYMYNTSKGLQTADPKPETIYDDWRQPVRDWLLAHPTDMQHPLNELVDVKPRITGG